MWKAIRDILIKKACFHEWKLVRETKVSYGKFHFIYICQKCGEIKEFNIE